MWGVDVGPVDDLATILGKKGGAAAPALLAPIKVARTSGTTYQILKPGNGAAVAQGCEVTVHATGVIAETRQQFWCTKDPGQRPFVFKPGVGAVIDGWDQGCIGMKIGEIRKLCIPGQDGYGKAGFSDWGIPPNATLEFRCEVIMIK